MKAIGETLRARARELGLLDAEVARRVGLSANRYSNYVTGLREPDLRTFGRICQVLSISADEVLGLTRVARETRPASRERIDALLDEMGEREVDLVARVVAALPEPSFEPTTESTISTTRTRPVAPGKMRKTTGSRPSRDKQA